MFIFTKNSAQRMKESCLRTTQIVQKVYHTLTRGCTATSAEDGFLAINIARDTT